MNHIGIILLFMAIGASIGWITNKIAIYFLFHPKEPKKILFWTVQGIFPKRQNVIAKRFSTLFVQEFFTSEMIHKELFSERNKTKLFQYLDTFISEFLDKNLKEQSPILSLFITENKKDKIRTTLLEYVSDQLANIIANFEQRIMEVIDIQQLIEDKINDLDSGKVNEVMQKIMDKELRFIEISGAVLGGVIGIIQGIIAIAIH